MAFGTLFHTDATALRRIVLLEPTARSNNPILIRPPCLDALFLDPLVAAFSVDLLLHRVTYAMLVPTRPMTLWRNPRPCAFEEVTPPEMTPETLAAIASYVADDYVDDAVRVAGSRVGDAVPRHHRAYYMRSCTVIGHLDAEDALDRFSIEDDEAPHLLGDALGAAYAPRPASAHAALDLRGRIEADLVTHSRMIEGEIGQTFETRIAPGWS